MATRRGGAWLLLLGVLVALGMAPLGFVAPRSPATALRGGRLVRTARGGAESGALIEELMTIAGDGNKDELAARVDKDFGKLSPEDLTVLQARFTQAPDDDKPAMEELTKCIQMAMESRMEKARADIDELLVSSGDINENIRSVLAKQDSPLPIISVLQLNIQQANANGNQKQEQALTYVLSVMAKQLQPDQPVTTRLLSRLLGTDESAERRVLLKAHLESSQDSAKGSASAVDELSTAIVAVVADAERQFKANDVPVEMRKQTLELIRGIALDAGVVVGEMNGEEAQGTFTEKLQPLFDALSRV